MNVLMLVAPFVSTASLVAAVHWIIAREEAAIKKFNEGRNDSKMQKS